MLVRKAARSAARQAMARKRRPSWLNVIFRWRSFSGRGPSTISTGMAWNTGRGLARPNGAIGSRPRTRSGVMCVQAQRAVDAQARPQLVRLEHLVGVRVDARAELRHPRRLHRQAGRLLVAAEPEEEIGAALERAEHVEVRDAAAGAVGDVAVDRQHDRRLVIRVDELRRGDADDAAMPALAADDEHVVRADGGVGLDRLLRLARRGPLLPAGAGGSRR